MIEMPTSTGHDRKNYSTTINLTRVTPTNENRLLSKRSEPNLTNLDNASSANSLRTDYGRKGTHRATSKLEMEYKQHEDNTVVINDPKLREIVQKLVKSERDRVANNIDPNLITQIDHKGYRLFFSRNGANPFEQRQPSPKQMATKTVQTDETGVEVNQVQVIRQPIAKSPVPRAPLQTIELNNPTTTNYNYNDNNGNNYFISEVNDMNNPTTNRVGQIEIPPEVSKIIQQDIAKNPVMGNGERSYRVVINRGQLGQGQKPQIVRIVVKNPQQTQYAPNTLPLLVSQPQQQQPIKIVQPIQQGGSQIYTLVTPSNGTTLRRNDQTDSSVEIRRVEEPVKSSKKIR